MLTVDFGRLPVGPGTRVLDLGCGAGRLAFESLRRGAHVVALDTDLAELKSVSAMVAAMDEAGEIPPEGQATCADGDATRMPFPDGSFDVVIAAEVLEHIPADQAALREISRVLAPGGVAAVTVPAWLPERICWRLSDDYHNVPGGHVRIFTLRELEIKLTATGLEVGGHHHAHALHSPYWWLKCAVGVHRDQHPLARAYHRLLVWDIMQRPRLTRLADRALNPMIGKSLVVYATKPATPTRAKAATRTQPEAAQCRSRRPAQPARTGGKGAPGGGALRSGGLGVIPQDDGEAYAGA
ncbi:MAG: class I SAM-dependent methyltransferase [Streptosporangiaceae bacterium]